MDHNGRVEIDFRHYFDRWDEREEVGANGEYVEKLAAIVTDEDVEQAKLEFFGKGCDNPVCNDALEDIRRSNVRRIRESVGIHSSTLELMSESSSVIVPGPLINDGMPMLILVSFGTSSFFIFW